MLTLIDIKDPKQKIDLTFTNLQLIYITFLYYYH